MLTVDTLVLHTAAYTRCRNENLMHPGTLVRNEHPQTRQTQPTRKQKLCRLCVIVSAVFANIYGALGYEQPRSNDPLLLRAAFYPSHLLSRPLPNTRPRRTPTVQVISTSTTAEHSRNHFTW